MLITSLDKFRRMSFDSCIHSGFSEELLVRKHILGEYMKKRALK
jgi:hypothetical protein